MNTEFENIYNLIPSEEKKYPKALKYTSKFRENVLAERKKNCADYKSMGQAKVPLPTTDNFLKKHSKEPILPEKKTFAYPDADHSRPPVPKKGDLPVMGMKTTKNFITTNAVENITSVPKKPVKIYVDTRNGDKNDLLSSGLNPKYIFKEDFGITPDYLKKRKRDMKRAQEEYDAYIADHFRRRAMKELTNAEKEEIINGLKANWEDMHHMYQNLSVVIDTVPKMYVKERMEHEMRSLERDIEIMEKHKKIYIAN